MEYSIGRTLELRVEDEEIDTFVSMLDSIKKSVKRSGFNKKLKPDELDMLDAIHYNLIGQHEENSD